MRVLIIDDCSTDATPEVASRLAARDSRVQVLRNEVNLGLIATANRGMLGWAEAPYSLLISADDALTPGALARAAAVLEAHPEVGFVIGAAIVFGSDPPPPAHPAPERFEHQVVEGPAFIEHICRDNNDVPTPTAVVRTELQQRAGGYNPAVPHTSDMEMWLRLAGHAKVGVINAAQAYYRVHSANMSAAYSSVPRRDGAERIRAAELALAAAGGGVAGFAEWIGGIRRREAWEACRRANLEFDAGEWELGEADLRFATETDRRVMLASSWWVAAVKRALGPRWLPRFRAACRRPPPPDIAGQLRSTAELSQGQLWGWWPGSLSERSVSA